MKLILFIFIIGLASCQSRKTTNQNIVALAGEQFLVRQPNNFELVISKVIYLDDNTIQCWSTNHQLQPLIKAKYNLNLNGQVSNQTITDNWQTQIVSAVLQIENEKVYTMLSSGQIVEISYQLVQNNINLQEIKRYKMVDYNGQWMQIDMFTDDFNLYGLYYGNLMTIQLNQNSGWNWGKQLTEKYLLRVMNYDVSIYALSQQKLSVFYEGELMQGYYAFQNETFIDFDIDDDNLFLLTTQQLVVIDINYFQEQDSIQLQYIQNAKRIRVKDMKLMVQFQRHGQVILREYAINQNYLLKGAIHRQYENTNEIILLDKFAIIVQNFQFNLLRLQLNSSHPVIPQDKQISIVYGDIVELKAIDTVGEDIFLMVVLPSSIQFITVKNKVEGFSLFQNPLTFVIENSGIYDMKIDYNGFCLNQILNMCSQVINYKIQIRTNSKNHVLLWVDIFIILVFSIIFVVIFSLYYWRRVLFQEIQKQSNTIREMTEVPRSTQDLQEASNQDKSQGQGTSYKF